MITSGESKNIGYLCTDWQVEQGRGEKVALKWISSSQEIHEFSYQDLTVLSNKAANVLKSHGLVKGDRVMILLPKIPELFYFFLGALKLGLNCCVLFSNLGEDSLSERIVETDTKLIISSDDFSFRLNRILPRLINDFRVLLIDDASQEGNISGIIDEFLKASEEFETLDTSHEQFSHFHFTSGSTGKPKGVQHIHGAVHEQLNSFIETMQPNDDDVYWCTADPGWVTGVSYGIIAPWVRGITQVQLEGNFNPEVWMKVIENNKVNIIFTAPTAFRMLMQYDEEFYAKYNLSSLKRIFCAGEPLNPPLIYWGRKIFKCDIFDIWFQTELASIMIANRKGLEVRPGSMGKPVKHVTVAILNENGLVQETGHQGLLCVKNNLTSMFVEYIKHPQVYQSKFNGDYYVSGDIAYQDKDGYIWFVGRNDDIINTGGHLVSPFEVESALMDLPMLIDVAVVGVPDPTLFEKVIAFVVLKVQGNNLRKLEMEIKLQVSKKISSIASPKEVIFVKSIPKTKSGKIMRRVLKRQYLKEDIGDVSTMEEI